MAAGSRNDLEAGTIAYSTPARKEPIPVWKHVVFVPLLFWVGLFIVGGLIVLAWNFWHLLME